MDKKLLALLVERSLTGNSLDDKKVTRIANQLSRKQLKVYIDGLKRWIQKNTVIVESARKVSKETQGEYKALFKDKNVVFRINPSLIVGTKIIDNDNIYALNLQNTLANIQRHITQD